MRRFLLFCVVPLLCETNVDMFRNYVPVSQNLKWAEAREYCRDNGMDLAKITNLEDHSKVTQLDLNGWIGMKRTDPGSDTWQWCDGEPANFFQWNLNQPDNWGGRENCVQVFNLGWTDRVCDVDLPFFCQNMITLEMQTVTWSEASKYCTDQHTGLAGSNATVTIQALTQTQIQTAAVWTGLRFMNGEWFWLDGQQAGPLGSLPPCPAPPYHCGAFNLNKQVWENRDCNEQLYFLCI